MRSGVWIRISERFREFQQEKKWHVESTGSRGQPEDNSWNAHAGTWNAYTGTWNAYSGTWNAYTGTWIRGSQKNLKSFLFFFDGCLFWLLAVCLCPASMSKHEVGFAHTNEIACKKQSRLRRGWFTAYTYGLKGLSAYTGKSWTPIQGFHESLYWENCSPITGKHPGIASKTPV